MEEKVEVLEILPRSCSLPHLFPLPSLSFTRAARAFASLGPQTNFSNPSSLQKVGMFASLHPDDPLSARDNRSRPLQATVAASYQQQLELQQQQQSHTFSKHHHHLHRKQHSSHAAPAATGHASVQAANSPTSAGSTSSTPIRPSPASSVTSSPSSSTGQSPTSSSSVPARSITRSLILAATYKKWNKPEPTPQASLRKVTHLELSNKHLTHVLPPSTAVHAAAGIEENGDAADGSGFSDCKKELEAVGSASAAGAAAGGGFDEEEVLALKHCRALRVLYLDNNSIGPSLVGLRLAPQITELHAQNNQVSSTVELGKLPWLEKVGNIHACIAFFFLCMD